MSVYVDDYNARFGRMIMCHMTADTITELMKMADKIGLARRWFQGHSLVPHFDVCLSMKKKAIAAGAIPVTALEAARMRVQKREDNKNVSCSGR